MNFFYDEMIIDEIYFSPYNFKKIVKTKDGVVHEYQGKKKAINNDDCKLYNEAILLLIYKETILKNKYVEDVKILKEQLQSILDKMDKNKLVWSITGVVKDKDKKKADKDFKDKMHKKEKDEDGYFKTPLFSEDEEDDDEGYNSDEEVENNRVKNQLEILKSIKNRKFNYLKGFWNRRHLDTILLCDRYDYDDPTTSSDDDDLYVSSDESDD